MNTIEPMTTDVKYENFPLSNVKVSVSQSVKFPDVFAVSLLTYKSGLNTITLDTDEAISLYHILQRYIPKTYKQDNDI